MLDQTPDDHGGNAGSEERMESWPNRAHKRSASRVPIVLQVEAAECGLACLAMVASHHGHETNLIDLRRRYSASLKGLNLPQLIQAAEGLGMRARPLSVELNSLHALKKPCILHWNFNHFVVLVAVKARRVVVHDPSCGRRELDLAEVSRCFTGIALDLEPGDDFLPRSSRARLRVRQLTGRLVGLKGALAQVLLLSLALQLLALASPFLVQLVLDQAIVAGDASLLALLGAGFALLLLIQTGLGLVRSWSVATLSERLGLQWKGNVFRHLLRLPLDFFQKRNLGDITSRIGSIDRIRNTLSNSFVEALIDGAMATVIVVVMWLYSPMLAALSMAAAAGYFGLRRLAMKPVRATVEQQLIRGARQHSHLLESLRGMQSLKAGACEPLRLSGYRNHLVATANMDLRQARLQAGFQASSDFLFGIERIAVICLGAMLVLDHQLSVGMLVAFIAYREMFAGRVAALIDKWVEFRLLGLHGERLADLVLALPEDLGRTDQPTEAAAAFQLIRPERTQAFELHVENLGYRYGQSEPWVFRHARLSVPAGLSVAIVGPSGCGKSTLAKLLMSLLPPGEGLIRVNGVDIRDVGVPGYRARLGAVLQDDHLFAGSIADNIAFFEPGADQALVEAAARKAHIHDEIMTFPMGYRTLIGDMGSTLSGGQKQRVLLARALYRQPSILVLDEATSHLDLAGERAVNDAVRALKTTRILIAHRRETIESADRVYALERGILRQL